MKEKDLETGKEWLREERKINTETWDSDRLKEEEKQRGNEKETLK